MTFGGCFNPKTIRILTFEALNKINNHVTY